MTKAIILTYAPVKEEEKELLKNTKIFKLAINQHAEELNPDMRICTDYILANICRNHKQKIISVRDKFRYNTDRVEYFDNFTGETITSAVDWLTSKGYNDILIVGDNTVNTKEFQDRVNRHLFCTLFNHDIRIFSYVQGNFFLPVKSIPEFIEEEDE